MKLRLWVLIIVTLGNMSSAWAMDPLFERLSDDDAIKNIRIFMTDFGETLLRWANITDLEAEGDWAEKVSALQKNASECWRHMQRDIYKNGEGLAWIAYFKAEQMLMDEDIDRIKSAYVAFCTKLSEEKFLGDHSKGFNPRDSALKATEFLMRFPGKDPNPRVQKLGAMFFPLALEEWERNRFVSGSHMRKQLEVLSQTPLSEERIDCLVKQAMKIYYELRVRYYNRLGRTKHTVDWRIFPEHMRPTLEETQQSFPTFMPKDKDLFSQQVREFLVLLYSVKECRSQSHRFGFTKQVDFFESLERAIDSKIEGLQKLHRFFSEPEPDAEHPIIRPENFVLMMQEMYQGLTDLRILFEERGEADSAQADVLPSTSFSLSTFDGILREEISSFSGGDPEVYLLSLRDFTQLVWPFVRSDIVEGRPLSMEKYMGCFQSEKTLRQRDIFQRQMRSLKDDARQQREALEKTLKQEQEALKELQKKEKDLIQQVASLKKKFEKTSHSLEKPKVLSESGQENPLKASLEASQSQLGALRKELKDLQAGRAKYEKDLEVKMEQEVTQMLLSQKSEFQRQQSHVVTGLERDKKELEKQKKELEVALERVDQQILSLTKEKTDWDLKTVFSLKKSAALFFRKSLPENYSWETFNEDLGRFVSSFEQKIQQLLLEKKGVEAALKAMKDAVKPSPVEDDDRLHKEKELRDQVSTLTERIREMEARAVSAEDRLKKISSSLEADNRAHESQMLTLTEQLRLLRYTSSSFEVEKRAFQSQILALREQIRILNEQLSAPIVVPMSYEGMPAFPSYPMPSYPQQYFVPLMGHPEHSFVQREHRGRGFSAQYHQGHGRGSRPSRPDQP